jgi:hypothetical protein
LKRLHFTKGSRNALKKVDYDSVQHLKVDYLPPVFNGDVVFEFPSIRSSSASSQAKLMVGMDKQHDGHVWIRTSTSHIKNDMGLTFCSFSCVGHLRCDNQDCEYLNHVRCTSQVNEMEWDGFTTISFQIGCQPPSQSSIICKICKTPPACVVTYQARIYYVSGGDHMTRAYVHLGVHEHPVKNGEYHDFKDRSRTLLEEQVERAPHATNSSIVMEATKELIGELLLRPEGAPTKTFILEELVPVLDKCRYMSSPSIKNDVTSFRYIRRYGVMDGITMLRGCSNWLYVQENMFPGQGTDFDKVFVFKMSEVDPSSGVDLVKRMQPGSDLEDAWMMFDHVKRIKKWTTMACHVYDSTYYRLMTIAVCNMQSEDTTAQSVLWKNFNVVLTRHGVPEPKFKGFMADSAQAN